MARPNEYNIDDMIKKINEYTDEEQVPILKEVCYKNGWNYIYLFELESKNPKLSESIRRLMYKKEVMLEKLGLFNVINSSIAKFSLFQLGWREKQEIEHTGNKEKPVMVSIADIMKG